MYIYVCDTWVFMVYQWYINPGWIPSAFQGHRGCQEIALEKAGAQPELGMALSISSEGFFSGKAARHGRFQQQTWECSSTFGLFFAPKIDQVVSESLGLS